jgi:choline dehydrogenase-like flavoprotein
MQPDIQPDSYDVIVIGGGVAAAHASYPLVKAGLRVAMIDGGLTAPQVPEPSGDFEDIRRSYNAQHEFFIGAALSDIAPTGGSHARSMISGSRGYVSARTEDLLPLDTEAQIFQSLAKGGFTESWGAVCALYDESELRAVGIPPAEMPERYRDVIERIGLSGEAPGYPMQPSALDDSHAKRMLHAYGNMSERTRARFKVKKPLLAMLTQPLGARQAISYRDLEFALNDGGAIYRARFTIEEMEREKNFTYQPGCIVERIVKEGSRYCVIGRDFSGGSIRRWARRVIVAAGALNTTRILLESFDVRGVPAPFIVKTNVLLPCLDLASIGQAGERRKHSFCQLVVEDTTRSEGVGASFSHLYSYKSLLLFRLARYLPLPMPETLSLLALWAPSLTIADVRFPGFEDTVRSNVVYDGKKIVVHATAALTPRQRQLLRDIKRLLRSLGQLPMRTVLPPPGASAHYAGGVPFSEGSTESFPLEASENGALLRDAGIYIADAATWRALSAKPPTLTIMANANRIGRIVARELGN